MLLLSIYEEDVLSAGPHCISAQQYWGAAVHAAHWEHLPSYASTPLQCRMFIPVPNFVAFFSAIDASGFGSSQLALVVSAFSVMIPLDGCCGFFGFFSE